MNVADIIKYETKDALTQTITKIQVLSGYVREAEAETQKLVQQALKELGVSPDQYVLEMNPQTNTWLLKKKGGAEEPATVPKVEAEVKA